MAKQFAPHIYRDWLPLFMTLPAEQAAEVLKGIAGFPDYEVKGVAIWEFFKSQLEKEYSAFAGRSEKARCSASVRWNADAKNEMRSDAFQCDYIKEDANVCEAMRTRSQKEKKKRYPLHPQKKKKIKIHIPPQTQVFVPPKPKTAFLCLRALRKRKPI